MKSGRRGDHAQRLQLGQRQVEPHGGLRRRRSRSASRRRRRRRTSRKLLKNAVAQPASASAALQTFLSGQGDVLLDYEDDGLYAKSQGEAVTVITPPQTILIQNPIAVTKTASPAAKAFLAYLLSPAGQTVWGKQGYRPVLPVGGGQVQLPQAQDACSPSTSSAAGRRSTRSSSTRRRASWPRSSSRSASPPPAVVAAPMSSTGASVGRPGSPGRRRRARRPPARAGTLAPHPPSAPPPALVAAGRVAGRVGGPALAVTYLSLLVLLPAGRAGHQGLQRRVERVLDADHQPAGGVRARADAGPLRHCGGGQLHRRPGHLLRARARRLPRQGARERGHRPPLRAADRRGRPHAAHALRRRQPAARRPGRHPARRRRRAALRDAALLRAQRPTGAGRARCRDRGRRRLPRAPRGARCSVRVILPSVLPSVLAGAGLAFARAVGEFGSIVLISGNLPFKTEVASSYIFGLSQSDDFQGASAVSIVLVAIALAGAHRHRLGPPALRRPGHGVKGSRWRLPLRYVVLVYLALLVVVPVGAVFYHAFAPGLGKAWDAFTAPDALHALLLTLHRGRHRRAAQHHLRRRRLAHPGPPPLPGGLAARCARRHPARPLPRRHRAGADPRLRPHGLVRQLAGRPRHHGDLLRARHHHGVGGRLAALRRARGPARCSRRSAPSRSRRPAPSAPAPSRSSAASRCPTSAAASPTA